MHYGYKSINVKNLDLIEGFSNFENKLNMTSNFDFKEIVPFDRV